MEALLGIGGLLIGSLVAWVVSTARAKLANQKRLGDAQSQLAALENSTESLKDQLSKREITVEELRSLLDTERLARTQSDTRLEESNKRFAEQQDLLQQADKKLKETFEALSAKALKSNAESFLDSAQKTMAIMLEAAKGDSGKREESFKSLIKPISESLRRYESQIQSLEQTRQEAYGSLHEQVKSLASTNQMLQQETGKLVTALRDPKVRGRWGELALKRSAELAGMVEHCDFEQQVHVAGDGANIRPDMIVHLPNGRTVVVDAKAVLDAYLDAVNATDEPARQRHLAQHASQVRSRVNELAGKAYWKSFETAPEFVVLFLPGESFFSAAVEADSALIEDAIGKRVILASPTTLIALLRAVAFGWQQELLTANAEKVRDLGRDLYDRIRILIDHLGKVGKNIGQTVDAYNATVGSLESRVLPSARRMKELGTAGSQEIPRLDAVNQTVRNLAQAPADMDQ